MSDFGGYYTEEKFWSKLAKEATKCGYDVVEKALLIFYVLQCSEKNLKIKGAAAAALGYLIFPFDSVPDVIPLIGYTDDLGILLAYLKFMTSSITEEVKDKTKDMLMKYDIHKKEKAG